MKNSKPAQPETYVAGFLSLIAKNSLLDLDAIVCDVPNGAGSTQRLTARDLLARCTFVRPDLGVPEHEDMVRQRDEALDAASYFVAITANRKRAKMSEEALETLEDLTNALEAMGLLIGYRQVDGSLAA